MNRRDAFSGAAERDSGTGGFLFYAESTVPVLRDLDDASRDASDDSADVLSGAEEHDDQSSPSSVLSYEETEDGSFVGIGDLGEEEPKVDSGDIALDAFLKDLGTDDERWRRG